MNQHEVENFLASRGYKDIKSMMLELRKNSNVIIKKYKGYETFLIKN